MVALPTTATFSLNPTEVEALYLAHFNYVRAACLKVMRNVDDAEEVAQDVFLRLLKPHSGFQGNSQARSWLYRIAINECLMRLRREATGKRKAEIMLQLTDAAIGTYEENPVARIAVERGLAAIAPGYRTVLLMHDVEGMEHGEIAEVLGVTEGTSKSQLHKSRIRMREMIERKVA